VIEYRATALYLPNPKFNPGKSSFLRKFSTLELYKTPSEFKDWANATCFTGLIQELPSIFTEG
jgi:hypothetical protein